MGNCLTKNNEEEQEATNESCNNVEVENTIFPDNCNDSQSRESFSFRFPTSENVDKLVLETLGVIGGLVDK